MTASIHLYPVSYRCRWSIYVCVVYVLEKSWFYYRDGSCSGCFFKFSFVIIEGAGIFTCYLVFIFVIGVIVIISGVLVFGLILKIIWFIDDWIFYVGIIVRGNGVICDLSTVIVGEEVVIIIFNFFSDLIVDAYISNFILNTYTKINHKENSEWNNNNNNKFFFALYKKIKKVYNKQIKYWNLNKIIRNKL